MEKSKDRIKKELSEYYFGVKADEYDPHRSCDARDRDVLDREVEIVHKFLKGLKKGKILDVACGTGRIFPFYGEREIYGTDISKDMLKIAKKKFPSAKLQVSDAEKLPFESESFPVVITSRFICHTPYYGEAIKEMTRVTEKGGFLLIDFPNKYSLSYFTAKSRVKRGEMRYYGLFTYSQIKKIAKDNNLDIVDIEGKIVISGKYFPKSFHKIIKNLNKVLVKVFWRFSYPYYVKFKKR